MLAFALVTLLHAQSPDGQPTPPATSSDAPSTTPATPTKDTDEAPTGTATTPVTTTPPAVAPTPPPPAPPIVSATPAKIEAPFGYTPKDGFSLASADGNNKVRIGGLVQPRFSVVAADSDTTKWTSSFEIKRAQIELSGTVFSKDIGFQLKSEFGGGQAFIKDAYIDFRIFEGAAKIRTGLWKRFFNRQEMTSDWRLAFLDRAVTNTAFFGGRDIGVALTNDIEKSPTLEYGLGVFSGTSEKPKVTGDVVLDPDKGDHIDNVKISNVPKLFTPTFVGRIGYNSSPDVQGYSEIDTVGGGFRFGVATSVLEAVDISGKGKGATRGEVDAIVKAFHVDAEVAVFGSAAQANPKIAIATDYDAAGFHAQAGVLLFDTVHPGVRYAAVTHADAHLEQEALVNVTWLMFGQNVEWGAEAGVNFKDAAPTAVFRTQAQVAF